MIRSNTCVGIDLLETKPKDTYEMVLDVIDNKLNINMSQVNIDKTHRLG